MFNDPTFDLSRCWSKQTAETLAATMRVAMEGGDKQPIRDLYRATDDVALRGVISVLMGAK